MLWWVVGNRQLAAAEFAAMRRANATDPFLIDDLPAVVLALDFSLTVLVHEMYNDALCSVVYYIRRVEYISG